MTRETRIAMLVGLLFIIMFGLVISELTGNSNAAPLKARPDTALAQRYAPVLLVEPPPPGDVPAEVAAATEGTRPSLEIASRAGEGAVVEATIVRRTEPERTAPLPASASPSASPREAGPLAASVTPSPSPSPSAAPSASPQPAGDKYVVKAGDNLIRIARAKYGPENERLYALIRQANRALLEDGDSLQIGMELVIPPPPAGVAVRPSPSPSPAPRTDGPRTLDLEGLRRAFAAGTSPLPSASPLAARGPAGARTGELAGAVPSPSPTPAPVAMQTYETRKGDSLALIARKVMKDGSRAAVQRLYKANKDKIRDPDDLPVGLKLEIPTQG